MKYLILGMGSFLLALLSKEYAVTLLFFIPFLFYLLENKKLFSAIIAAAPYYGIAGFYLLLRYNAVGFNSNMQSAAILGSNPYLFATHAQKMATEWFVLGKYIGLLLFPYPLSYDYSFYQITYHNFTDVTVIVTLVIYSALIGWGIMLARKKNVLSFAVFFFLLTIFMVSNFALNIGAAMGERLIFHSSLGFVIILSYYLLKVISTIPVARRRSLVMGGLSLIVAVCFGETIMRNTQWKNDISLDIHDVNEAPDSFLTNNNAGRCYWLLSREKENAGDRAKDYRDSARKYLYRSLHFNPRNEFTYLNLAYIYADEGLPDSAKYCYDMVGKLNPNLPLKPYYTLLSQQYYMKGLALGKEGKLQDCLLLIKKALLYDSTNAGIWYNTGIAYYRLQQYDSAQYAFAKTLQCQPDSATAANAMRGMQALLQLKN